MGLWSFGYAAFTCLWIAVIVMRNVFCLDPGTWADWVSAIGTLSAFIGTLWIATTETRRRNSEKNTIALVSLMEVEQTIVLIRSTALSITAGLNLLKQNSHSLTAEQWQEGINIVVAKFDLIPKLDSGVLKDIAGREKKVAYNLAALQGIVKGMHQYVASMRTNRGKDRDKDLIMPLAYLEEVGKNCSEISKYLKKHLPQDRFTL